MGSLNRGPSTSQGTSLREVPAALRMTVSGKSGLYGLCSLCSSAHDRLRTMAAAARVDRDLAQAFGALLGGRIGRRWVFAGACDQGVDGSHNKEVNRRRNQQEAYEGGDEVANRKHRGTDGERDRREVGLAHE